MLERWWLLLLHIMHCKEIQYLMYITVMPPRKDLTFGEMDLCMDLKNNPHAPELWEFCETVKLICFDIGLNFQFPSFNFNLLISHVLRMTLQPSGTSQ